MGRAALLAWRITLGGSVAAACATTTPDESRTAANPSGDSGGAGGGTAVDAASAPESASVPGDSGVADADAAPQPRMVAIYSDTVVTIGHFVQFKSHSARLSPEMKATLEIVAQLLRTNPRLERMEVQGYADAGEGRAAKWLAEQRARAVRDRLVKLGISAERLIAKGYGASKPELARLLEGPKGKGNALVLFQILSLGDVRPSDGRDGGRAGD
jgi:outer membrane protein OmpA-like peptidoglycan-associated protein